MVGMLLVILTNSKIGVEQGETVKIDLIESEHDEADAIISPIKKGVTMVDSAGEPIRSKSIMVRSFSLYL